MSARRYVIALVLGLSCVVLLLATSKRAPSSTIVAKPEGSQHVAALAPPASAVMPTVHPGARSDGKLAQSCEQVCQASAKLGCRKAAACKASCEAMASTGVCEAQLGAFFDCLKAQPSEHWECLEDGTGAIRESYCENEQASFAACLQEKQI